MLDLITSNKKIFELRVSQTVTSTYHIAALTKEEAEAAIAQFPERLSYFAVYSETTLPVIASLREVPKTGDS